MSEEKLQEELQEEDNVLKKQKFLIILIAALCACLGVAALLITMFGSQHVTSDNGVPCAEKRCNGFYINGICSKDDTH